MNLYINYKNLNKDFEVVERKGWGHPDTITDHLAEFLSACYSEYTKERFGAVLHHNFDKLALLGGASDVVFGGGKMTKPIRVLLNGRASSKFADEIIPVEKMLEGWVKDFLKERIPNINPETDLEIHFNLSSQSSPGKTDEKGSEKGTRKYWFEPRSLEDISELKRLHSNDTSMGVGYAPFSKLENFILDLEESLTRGSYKKDNPWVGGDVKLMGVRNGDVYQLTLCIPHISTKVISIEEYISNIKKSSDYIIDFSKSYGIENIEVYINTRDDYDKKELYLTFTGSSLESGDEGVVGRGNRINKLISATNPISMEGSAGKNPVYHIGKLYYILADKVSGKIFQSTGLKNEVFIVSQSGRLLLDPWIVNVNIDAPVTEDLRSIISTLLKEEVKNIPQITQDLLDKKLTIC